MLGIYLTSLAAASMIHLKGRIVLKERRELQYVSTSIQPTIFSTSYLLNVCCSMNVVQLKSINEPFPDFLHGDIIFQTLRFQITASRSSSLRVNSSFLNYLTACIILTHVRFVRKRNNPCGSSIKIGYFVKPCASIDSHLEISLSYTCCVFAIDAKVINQSPSLH